MYFCQLKLLHVGCNMYGLFAKPLKQGAQILGIREPGQPKFCTVMRRLMFVGYQCGICFMLPIQCLNFETAPRLL
jgi:hypothetical protein